MIQYVEDAMNIEGIWKKIGLLEYPLYHIKCEGSTIYRGPQHISQETIYGQGSQSMLESPANTWPEVPGIQQAVRYVWSQKNPG